MVLYNMSVAGVRVVEFGTETAEAIVPPIAANVPIGYMYNFN